MSPLPCLCSYPGPYCYPISPNSDLFCGASRILGWAWEREKEDPGSSLLLQGSQEAGSQERWCEFIIWVAHPSGTTQRNSTELPFCRVCSQLPRFPKSGCSDTNITASLSFWGKRDLSFLHLDNLTSSNQTNRLSLPLSQKDIVKTKDSWLERVRFWVCSPDTYQPKTPK